MAPSVDPSEPPNRPASGWAATEPPRKPNHRYLLGLAPILLFLGLEVLVPGFLQPIFDARLADGTGVGIWILFAIMFLAVCGILVMRLIPTTFGAVLGFLVFTAPSLFLVIFGPAICLIYTNLSDAV
jgi:hypothetical protein